MHNFTPLTSPHPCVSLPTFAQVKDAHTLHILSLWGSPSQAASPAAVRIASHLHAQWCCWAECWSRCHWAQSCFPLHVPFTGDSCHEERFSPEPWEHHSRLCGAADLHRNPSNGLTLVASVLLPQKSTKGHRARITSDDLITCENSCKALWGFRVVALWIGGERGDGIRRGGAGRGWPVMAEEHSVVQSSKGSGTGAYGALLSQRVCFSWLVTWNQVGVTRGTSCTTSTRTDERFFPYPLCLSSKKAVLSLFTCTYILRNHGGLRGSRVYACWYDLKSWTRLNWSFITAFREARTSPLRIQRPENSRQQSPRKTFTLSFTSPCLSYFTLLNSIKRSPCLKKHLQRKTSRHRDYFSQS